MSAMTITANRRRLHRQPVAVAVTYSPLQRPGGKRRSPLRLNGMLRNISGSGAMIETPFLIEGINYCLLHLKIEDEILPKTLLCRPQWSMPRHDALSRALTGLSFYTCDEIVRSWSIRETGILPPSVFEFTADRQEQLAACLARQVAG